jgi:hypothetical protein
MNKQELEAEVAVAKLRDVLKRLVECDDEMNDEENPDKGTYPGAYYAYYKGKFKLWEEARARLEEVEQ